MSSLDSSYYVTLMGEFAFTKHTVSFEDWFEEVIREYSKGFLNAPVFGADPTYPYKWYTPDEEQIEKFKSDPKIVELYRYCYNDGDTPGSALDRCY